MSLNVIKRAEKVIHDPTMVVCMRCLGRKKVYKLGSGYSLANCGGVEIDCPMCSGVGKHKKASEALPEVKAAIEEETKIESNKKSKKI